MAIAEFVLCSVGSRAIESQTRTVLHGLDVRSSLEQPDLLHAVVIGERQYL